jgi:hypothetical protein
VGENVHIDHRTEADDASRQRATFAKISPGGSVPATEPETLEIGVARKPCIVAVKALPDNLPLSLIPKAAVHRKGGCVYAVAVEEAVQPSLVGIVSRPHAGHCLILLKNGSVLWGFIPRGCFQRAAESHQ